MKSHLLLALGALASVAAQTAQADPASAGFSTTRRALASPLGTAATAPGSASGSRILTAPGSTSGSSGVPGAGHFFLTYDNEWDGPSLGNADRLVPDDLGEPLQYQLVENWVTMGVYLSKKTTIGVVANSIFQPDGATQHVWKDPYLLVKTKKLIDTGGFTAGGDLRLYVPTTQKSRDTGLDGSIRVSPKFEYSFPGSRWAVGTRSYVRTYVLAPADTLGTPLKKPRKDWSVFFGPYATYQLAPKLKAICWYESYALHPETSPGNEWASDGTDLRPAVSWDVTDYLNLTPFLNLFPAGKMDLRSTYVGLQMSITLI
jgi:hypothetical protein